MLVRGLNGVGFNIDCRCCQQNAPFSKLNEGMTSFSKNCIPWNIHNEWLSNNEQYSTKNIVTPWLFFSVSFIGHGSSNPVVHHMNQILIAKYSQILNPWKQKSYVFVTTKLGFSSFFSRLITISCLSYIIVQNCTKLKHAEQVNFPDCTLFSKICKFLVG